MLSMISNEKIAMFTEKELARELNISLPKLRKDRVKGIGFNYVKIGKSVRYPMYDVHLGQNMCCRSTMVFENGTVTFHANSTP